MSHHIILLDDLIIHTDTIAYARRYPTGDVAITFTTSPDAPWLRGKNGPRFWFQWLASVPGDAGLNLTLTIEDAKLAAQGINAYMANWSNSESVYHGARVASLGGFFGITFGRLCRLWLVDQWDWDHPGTSSLLFEEREGRFAPFTSSPSFGGKDLYTNVVEIQVSIPEGRDANQEGGVA